MPEMITDALGITGRDTGTGYTSPHTAEYESGARSGIYNRLGAKRKQKTGADGKPVTDDQGNPVYDYDTTDVGKPVSTEDAKAGYSFGDYDKATGELGKKFQFGEKYTSGYDPTAYKSPYARTQYEGSKFGYEGLPKEYGDLAYQAGAKDVRREGQGQLEQLKETIGTRRPGLLLKAAEGAQRGQRESLADLGSKVRLSEMEKSTDLKVQQQRDQAEENFKKAGFDDATARQMADEQHRTSTFAEQGKQFLAGEKGKEYESKARIEDKQSAENLERDKASVAAIAEKIGLERGVTESERDYKDRAMEWLMQQFGTTSGLSGAQAGRDLDRRGQNFDLLGKVLNTGSSAIQGLA